MRVRWAFEVGEPTCRHRFRAPDPIPRWLVLRHHAAAPHRRGGETTSWRELQLPPRGSFTTAIAHIPRHPGITLHRTSSPDRRACEFG